MGEMDDALGLAAGFGVVEQSESQRDEHAARRWERVGPDARSPVSGGEWLAQLGAIVREILRANLATGAAQFDQGRAERSAIEEVRTFPVQGFERAGQFRLVEHFSLVQGPVAAARVDASGLFGRAVDRRDDLHHVALQGRDRDACASGPDRRLHQAFERQATQVAMDVEQTAHEAGRRRRADADVELLGDAAEIRVDRVEVERVGRGARKRRLHEEVVEHRLAVRRMRKQEAASGERRKDGLRDACRALRRDDGVERVAPVAQDLGGGRCGHRVAARDRAEWSLHAGWPCSVGSGSSVWLHGSFASAKLPTRTKFAR